MGRRRRARTRGHERRRRTVRPIDTRACVCACIRATVVSRGGVVSVVSGGRVAPRNRKRRPRIACPRRGALSLSPPPAAGSRTRRLRCGKTQTDVPSVSGVENRCATPGDGRPSRAATYTGAHPIRDPSVNRPPRRPPLARARAPKLTRPLTGCCDRTGARSFSPKIRFFELRSPIEPRLTPRAAPIDFSLTTHAAVRPTRHTPVRPSGAESIGPPPPPRHPAPRVLVKRARDPANALARTHRVSPGTRARFSGVENQRRRRPVGTGGADPRPRSLFNGRRISRTSFSLVSNRKRRKSRAAYIGFRGSIWIFFGGKGRRRHTATRPSDRLCTIGAIRN